MREARSFASSRHDLSSSCASSRVRGERGDFLYDSLVVGGMTVVHNVAQGWVRARVRSRNTARRSWMQERNDCKNSRR